MPSYNQASFLDEAIASVVSQIDCVHEFFVLDGGSTDGSVEIIKKYEKDITHWQSKPDGGQSNAISDGFEMCTGDVIAFLNSDDLYLPGSFDAVLDAFDADEGLGFVEGFTVVVDHESRVLYCDQRLGSSGAWLSWGQLRTHQPSTFFKRSVYESVGGINRSLQCVLDTELWYRMLPECRSAQLNRYTAVHRVHDDAKGSSWGEIYTREREMLDEKFPQFRDSKRLKLRVGNIAAKLTRSASGRSRAAKKDTALYVGKRVSEVFR
jgi:glycosyltransferase involved in cell wall biosynthesis